MMCPRVWLSDRPKMAPLASTSQMGVLEGAENWIDEAYRVDRRELDYAGIIEKQLTHLRKVRSDFEKMDGSTY